MVWDQSQSINDFKFTNTQFGIQIHNLPTECMNEENAFKWEEKVGKVIGTEMPFMEGRPFRPFVRVRVLVDITKPLKIGWWIKKDYGKR